MTTLSEAVDFMLRTAQSRREALESRVDSYSTGLEDAYKALATLVKTLAEEEVKRHGPAV